MNRLTFVILLLISLLCSSCFDVLYPEVQNLPTPCDRACDVLKSEACPEGMYTMCRHSRLNECAQQINVGCVMKAKTRQEIIACGVKCEW